MRVVTVRVTLTAAGAVPIRVPRLASARSRSRRRQAPGVATPARGPSARLRVRSGEPDPIPFILHSLPRAAPAA